MKTYTAAIIGLAHPHAATLKNALKNQERFRLIGYADAFVDGQTHEERMTNLGATDAPFFESWEELLELHPDLVVIAASNNAKLEPALKALSYGALVVLEKPMAGKSDDCIKMVKCAKEHNTHVITNWPIAWFPAFREAGKRAKAGEIGEIRRVVYRSPATWGPYSYAPDGVLPPEEFLKRTWWYSAAAGGGSLLDYACYGTVLSTWIFGRAASRASAITKNFEIPFSDTEDYSAVWLDFGQGVGLLEGSWSSFNPGQIPSGPVIYGSEGVIVCDRHSAVVKIYRGRSHQPVPPAEVIDMKEQCVAGNLGDHLLEVLDGGPVDELLEESLNLRVVAALEAAARSAQTGQAEALRPTE